MIDLGDDLFLKNMIKYEVKSENEIKKIVSNVGGDVTSYLSDDSVNKVWNV